MYNQTDYQQRMEKAKRDYERAHIFALSVELIEYRKTVETLLENGSTIFEQATGERFLKIYEKRRELWHKIATIDHCIEILYKHTF